MNQVRLNGKAVRINKGGMVCFTDIWKASGGDNKKRPNHFLDNAQTKRFVAAFPAEEHPAVDIIKGGNSAGTWGHKLLAYKYASWIDPQFEHGVYTVLDRFFDGRVYPKACPMERLNNIVLKERVSSAKGKKGSALMHERKREKQELVKETNETIADLQMTLPFNSSIQIQ